MSFTLRCFVSYIFVVNCYFLSNEDIGQGLNNHPELKSLSATNIMNDHGHLFPTALDSSLNLILKLQKKDEISVIMKWSRDHVLT